MAPQPARRPEAVKVESPASGPLHNLLTELLAAKNSWEQLGIKIAKGYRTAYGVHAKTLKDMETAKKDFLSNDALIFVMSILSVGVAGGIVGSLVAPWVEKAGTQVAKKVFRASVVAGVGTQAMQTITDAGVKKLWAVDVPAEPYKPVVPETIAVDLEIRDRIASAFGPILDAVKAMIASANQIQAPVDVGQIILNNFRMSCPLLTDEPEQEDMPSDKQASDWAELAMWVAWANERDWIFWNEVYKAMDVGWQRAMHGLNPNDSVTAATYAHDMDPVGNRLAMLGKWVPTLSVVRYYKPSTNVEDSGENILYTDLRKVRALRLDDGSLPFQRLPGLQLQWDKTKPFERVKFLNQMGDVKPVYK
jgi:hypothetical protein